MVQRDPINNTMERVFIHSYPNQFGAPMEGSCGDEEFASPTPVPKEAIHMGEFPVHQGQGLMSVLKIPLKNPLLLH